MYKFNALTSKHTSFYTSNINDLQEISKLIFVGKGDVRMTVYVDQSKHKLGRMVMCHMAADSLEELHQMATQLGVSRWFQDKPGAPHYDICKKNRARAIQSGATEVSSRDLLLIARKCK